MHHDEGPCLVREIAEEESIPRHYLAKILQQLASHGLVRSTKGPGGGFALAREPQELMISEIVDILEPHVAQVLISNPLRTKAIA